MISVKVNVQTSVEQIMTGMVWIALFLALFIANASALPVTNSNRPDVTPVLKTYMQNLLKRYVQQKKDFGTFLANQPDLTLAEGTIYSTEISDLNKLPAPPDSALQSAVDSFDEASDPSAFHPPIRLLWLPTEKIGAVYFDEGSGACLTYFLFRSDGKTASLIDTPDIFTPDVCGDEGGRANDVLGSNGFLVKRGHQVLALVFTFEQFPPFNNTTYKFSLEWEEWSPAGWRGSSSDTAMVTTNSP
jgi:hypothetical protein